MVNPAPPAMALDWAVRTAGPGATARDVVRLAGGTHASTHLIRIERPTAEVVLRRFPPGDDAARREARVLSAIDGLGGLAPRLLAADPDGQRFGEPAVVITRIPGRAHIGPRDACARAERLGAALARVHAHPIDSLGHFRDVLAVAAPPAMPDGARDGDAIRAVSEVAAGWERLVGGSRVLTHYDFWSGNVLWSDDRLTGVIDWSGAALGPRGFDLAWCRLDLALLHGPDAADTFLAGYQAAADVVVDDIRLWDLWTAIRTRSSVVTWLPNYQDLGRTDLTAGELRKRHTEWTNRRLARS
ncbi:phosphotransferase family protein [Plantactinospora sp. GCM10030261]|uniref:phosphotransferase family protein n=1 Tax=Plantactinospora sp. GCM10030261 TaxID=3273420 RepID=UPI00360C4631